MNTLEDKIEEIVYHLYESSGNSKYIRSDHVGKPLHPDEATTQLKQLIETEVQERINTLRGKTNGK